MKASIIAAILMAAAASAVPAATTISLTSTMKPSSTTTTASRLDPTERADPPGPADPARVYFLTLNATTSGINTPGKPKYDTISVHLNHLSFSQLEVTELAIVPGSGVNLNAKDVECRMYKDKAGTMPGSAGFTEGMPARISTNPVPIGSILCYEVKSS